jgi:hypothetical protein
MTRRARLLSALGSAVTILAALAGAALAPGVSLAAPKSKQPPPPPGPRTILFSGHQWTVKDSGSARWGPGPNYFSPSSNNVWVDSQGRLHLKITNSKGKWSCAEVVSKTSFGHGSYRFYLDSAVDRLDRNVVLGLFTWHDTDPSFANREIDIEFARWGNAADPEQGQYVVQPYDDPGNLVRFTQPQFLAQSTHLFDWRPGRVEFRSLHGHRTAPAIPGDLIDEWTFADPGQVPPAGGEQARMNLWLFRGAPPSDRRAVEVVVSRFEFIPAP